MHARPLVSAPYPATRRSKSKRFSESNNASRQPLASRPRAVAGNNAIVARGRHRPGPIFPDQQLVVCTLHNCALPQSLALLEHASRCQSQRQRALRMIVLDLQCWVQTQSPRVFSVRTDIEAAILILSGLMFSGLTAHPATLPSVQRSLAYLETFASMQIDCA